MHQKLWELFDYYTKNEKKKIVCKKIVMSDERNECFLVVPFFNSFIMNVLFFYYLFTAKVNQEVDQKNFWCGISWNDKYHLFLSKFLYLINFVLNKWLGLHNRSQIYRHCYFKLCNWHNRKDSENCNTWLP